ncbi:Predicted arabinose efflux permease, MFS family [Streptomyces sp. DvalAA-14]|uniref:MFS transporter n=1 Tax=unclassified Streptomyces TaxID=2593676 RepID=UPI00081B059F|nr:MULTISPECIES: MFS transporter [unclassified Streptomyces]MYS20009.1 MFS transporter [Streptomyces sp. SID4948]SCD58673.1 Predicted arabinose efflux permease, MFS family [Streptomyces sp. DvalAA-14]
MHHTCGSGRRPAHRHARPRGRSTSPWPHVVATWLAGTLAAVGLGAVAPVSPAVRSSLGLSLGTVAWATSGMTAVGAVLGIPVGWWTSRFCARRALLVGLVALAAAAGLSAVGGPWALLLTLRTAEGVGFLLVFVAGPIVVTGLTRGRTRAAALGLWGTCVPTGVALAAAVGGALASGLSWNYWLGVTGIGPLLLAGYLAVTLPHPPAAGGADGSGSGAGAGTGTVAVAGPLPAADTGAGQLPLAASTASTMSGLGPGIAPPPVAGANRRWSRAAGILARCCPPAGAYACLALISVAVLVLLPDFLIEVRHRSFAGAGAAVAVVSASSAVGGLLAGRLLRRGVGLKTLAPLAAVMPLGCLPAFSPRVPIGAGVAAAALVLFVDGLLISAVFAAVPAIAVRAGDIDLANGALAQFGSLGLLMGPPVYGLAVAYAGWGGTVAATAVFAAPTVGLLLATARRVTAAAPDVPAPPPRELIGIGKGNGTVKTNGTGTGNHAVVSGEILDRRYE